MPRGGVASPPLAEGEGERGISPLRVDTPKLLHGSCDNDILLHCLFGFYCVFVLLLLCCVVLCCVVLCRVVLCCVVLCRVVLCCVVLCCVVLCCVVLCCVVLCQPSEFKDWAVYV